MVTITKHAYERAKERLSWSRSVLDKMADIAYNDGVKHSDTKGSLNKYITKLWFRHQRCNNVRIYGENVFLFLGDSLITIYQLPNNMKKRIKFSK